MKSIKIVSNKFVALMLAMLLVITSIPITVFTAFAANQVSFIVADEQSHSAISNAQVTVLGTKVDGLAVDIISAENTVATSNSQGKVSFDELDDYIANNQDTNVSVELKIEAADYQTIDSSVLVVNSTSTEDDLTINMSSNPVVNFEITGRSDKTITFYKNEVSAASVVTSGSKVEVGTEIIAVLDSNPNDGNYSLDVSPQYTYDENYGNYRFTVGTENLDILFSYTEFYTITATIVNGKIDKADDQGKIFIIKTENKTEITLIPDEHFHLHSFKLDGVDKTADVDENNKYVIDNTVINDNTHTIEANFAINTSKVTVNTNSNGSCKLLTENIDMENMEKVSCGTELTFQAIPNSNYYISNVTVNKKSILTDDIIADREFTVTVEDVAETDIYISFDNIEKLANLNFKDAFDISFNDEHYYLDEANNTYYLGPDTNITVSPKQKISYSTDGTDKTLEKSIMDIYSSTHTNKKNTHWLKEYSEKSSNDDISPLQIINSKTTYLVPGTIKVRVDSAAPEISNIQDIQYTNIAQTVPFTVTDPTETFNNTEYSSGIDIDSITAARKYYNNGWVNENVDVIKSDGSYSLECNPIAKFAGEVTYTITAKDRVGNETIKTFYFQNDKVAPVINGKGIEFTNGNDSVFAKFFNTISFGKWFNEKIIVKINAKDEGVGFDGDKSMAYIAFVNENGSIYKIKSGKIETDGTVTDGTVDKGITFDKISEFKGKVYYNIFDSLENGKATDLEPDNEDDLKNSGWKLVTSEVSNYESEESSVILIEDQKPKYSITDVHSLNSNPVIENIDGKNISNDDIGFKLNLTEGNEDIFSGIYSHSLFINDVAVGNDVKEEKSGKIESGKIVLGIRNKTYEYSTNVANVSADENGAFKIKASVIDASGNVSDKKDDVVYYVDKTFPVITGFTFNLDKNIDANKNNNTDLYDVVQVQNAEDGNPYAFYFTKDVEVTVTAQDIKQSNEIASGIKEIFYVAKGVDVDNKPVVIKGNGLNADKKTVNFTIPTGFKGQIYAYAVDNVKNSPFNSNAPTDYNNDLLISSGDFANYASPNGAVLEDSQMHLKTSSVDFTSIPTQQGTQNNTSNYAYQGDAQKDGVMDYDVSKKVPLYNNDIYFGVKVSDTYSGIREVSYSIIEGNDISTKTVTVDNNGSILQTSEGWSITRTDKNLVTEMTNTISVSGNYNDMVLLIELTDRAGNKSYDYYVFGIDKTAPLITVTYDNNSSDTQSGTGDYFKDDRTATILVQERNFNTENVIFTLKNDEGDIPKIADKGLFVKDDEGNGDGNVYKYIITYNTDGVYTFDVDYTDRATNKATVDYKDSVAPKAFVLDKTLPVIRVSYDNNDARNGKFFKAYRTATVTVAEHNFDVNRVLITQTASLSGNSIANPAVSWASSGDTHTATIHYNADGDYTFDITMTDKAGNKETDVNYGPSVSPKEFTVDTDYKDIVKVDGIANGDVLGLKDGTVDPDAKIKITINDVNLDNYNIKLMRSRVLVNGESDEKTDADRENVKDSALTNNSLENTKYENDVDVTSYVSNASGNKNAVAVISIPKKDNGVKNDGLYTLTIEAKDKAGNAYNTNANVITFSVNRYGSVFTFSKDLYDLIYKNDGYTKSVSSNDLTVYEYNATSLKSESVEVIANNDSKILSASTDYTVSKDTKQTDTSWSKYNYNVKPDNFKNDGVYTLRIYSKDDAHIKSQTVDYDVCSATFRVDSTPADIISVNYSTEINKIAGHNGGSAKTDNLTVSFTVEDLIRLEKVEVFINDMQTPKKSYIYGKDFDDANIFEGGSFDIPNDIQEQSFKIVATDKAGNVIDTSKGDSNGNEFEPGYVFFDHITVTTNQIVIWAKSPVFWVVIGGVVAAAVGLTIFVVVKKRKKDDE